MPPQLAAFLSTIFILWLLFRDSRRRRGISITLWIPLTWAFVISSRPVSLWFGDTSVGADGRFEDSLLDKGLFFLLIAIGLVVVIGRRKAVWHSVFKNKWLFVYFLYLALSVSWSDDPLVAFKRWFKDFGNIVMVLVLLSEDDPVEAITAFLARYAYLMIPLSVLAIKYYPETSRTYDIWSNKPSFQGITMGKNMMGMSLFVCALSLFWLWLEMGSMRLRTNRTLVMAEYFILCAMAVWLLTISNAATAVICTIVGAGILLALRVPVMRGQIRWLGTMSVLLMAVVALLQGTGLWAALMTQFTQTVGRDTTMHGRDAIWRAVLAEDDVNPLIGVGFYSFWTPERDQRLSEGFYYLLGEAHNGYIETYLTGGLIGLSLLMIAIASAVRRMKRDVLKGATFGDLRVAFTIPILIYNISESIFDRLGGGLWFVLILMTMVESRTVPAAGSVSQSPRRVPDQAPWPNTGRWAPGRRKQFRSPALPVHH